MANDTFVTVLEQEGLINDLNYVLSEIASGEVYPLKYVTETFEEFKEVQEHVKKIMAKHDLAMYDGCYRGSIASLIKSLDLSNDRAKECIRILKDTDRILQIGAGWGKGFVILSTLPFEKAGNTMENAKTMEEKEYAPAKDFRKTLKDVVDAYHNLEPLYAEHDAEIEKKNNRIHQLETVIKKKDVQIKELNEKLMTTWT